MTSTSRIVLVVPPDMTVMIDGQEMIKESPCVQCKATKTRLDDKVAYEVVKSDSAEGQSLMTQYASQTSAPFVVVLEEINGKMQASRSWHGFRPDLIKALLADMSGTTSTRKISDRELVAA